MSELFKALQRLEEQKEQNAPEIPQAFSSSQNARKPKNSQPFLKPVLLCVLLLVLTFVCLGFTWFAKDYFLPPSTGTQSGADFEKENSVPTAEPISAAPVKTILPPATSLPVSEQVVVEGPIALTAKPLASTNENSVLHDPNKENTSAITRKRINLEQFIENSTSNVEKEQSRARQRKRILYQAEKVREQGDLPNALILYKKAWSYDPNPAIANNLAAILIQSRQYEEAEEYLKQVIALAPEDEDLRFNLEIARKGRRNKKILLDKK